MATRTLEDVTDDELVDAVAACGVVHGLDLEDPWDGNPFHQAMVGLALVDEDADDDDAAKIEGALADRMRALKGRIYDDDGSHTPLNS